MITVAAIASTLHRYGFPPPVLVPPTRSQGWRLCAWLQCAVCGTFPIVGTMFSCNSPEVCRTKLCTSCFRTEQYALSGTCSLTHPFFAFR